MAGINRVGSPMDLIDDASEELSKELIEKKKRSLEAIHRNNSRILEVTKIDSLQQ